jgi:hypothetical protein
MNGFKFGMSLFVLGVFVLGVFVAVVTSSVWHTDATVNHDRLLYEEACLVGELKALKDLDGVQTKTCEQIAKDEIK